MRPVFVGDVQGCGDELDELLARARRAFGRDFAVWSVGDLINRGPDNLRVLRRVRRLVDAGRGQLVLGNHELALLRTALGLRNASPRDSFADLLEAPDLVDWIRWLSERPLVVTGRLGETRFAMVHAAAHPAWDLETLEARAARAGARLAQDPAGFLAARGDPDLDVLERLTTCRSVAPDDDAYWSPLPPVGDTIPWHEAWSARGHRYGVVYGHWSLQGLHVAPGLRGLDTGCVHHGRGRDGLLTAWVPEPRGQPFAAPDDRFWQVRAHRVYYDVD